MESETVEDVGDVALVETPHVAMVWEGLEELKEVTSCLGQVLSSSCIPSASTVGKLSVDRESAVTPC